MGVLRPTIKEKTTEVMQIACILSIIYRKLPHQVSFTQSKKYGGYVR
jgi:hypothetical protein